MGEYIGVRRFCLLCEHSKLENGNLICKNEKSDFYNLVINNLLLARCFSPKETKEETIVECVGLGD